MRCKLMFNIFAGKKTRGKVCHRAVQKGHKGAAIKWKDVMYVKYVNFSVGGQGSEDIRLLLLMTIVEPRKPV